MKNNESSITKYKVDIFKFGVLNRDLILPTFQRKLVWSNKQKQSFIDTLIDKYPFGSLLLYKYENGNSYSLIDGLQRISTMRDFKANPTDYIHFNDYIDNLELMLPDEFSEQAKSDLRLFAEQLFKEVVNDYYNNYKMTQEDPRFDKRVRDSILNEFPIFSEFGDTKKLYPDSEDNISVEDALDHIQRNVINSFESKLNIDDVEIPCIIFHGKEEELADVFQRLNTGGQKLSKYQVFAAAWDSYEIKLSNSNYSNQLLEKVIDRYNGYIEDHEIEIVGFDEDQIRENKKINLSEFCYGLGSMIADKLPVFFKNKNEDLYNELGYQTLSIVFKVPTIEMTKLVNYIDYLRTDINQIEDLLDKITTVYSVINRYFSDSFSIPGHGGKKYETGSFTRLQILSFFASLWNVEYNFNPDDLDPSDGLIIKNQTKRKVNRQSFKDNIIKHAIYDSLRKYWSATGDRKLAYIYVNNENRYLEKLDKGAFENELNMWNREMTNKANIRINSEVKMLLAYLLNFDVQKYNDISENFDYEHIIPRKALNPIYKPHIIPGGSIGNIMLLDENTNRKLKDKYLYEIEDRDDLVRDIKGYYELSSYPSKEKIEKIKNTSKNKLPDIYKEVILSRGNEIITRIIEETFKTK